ncbi:hypothetical protein P7228_04750 [Altererythrobacter arenosus]|uniref:Uncharacterized protein n=1 Tax=Altererythrobacter arenosus TaxID=3032592 RepID=A0ABY8FYC3_9SPHN|nr:hypothetical protein [Altererythrobacter sp. CAU 1644]WFL78376.1 hypothetical protein P7228_04750 [Altererythrobacter sp. CAU 1644]
MTLGFLVPFLFAFAALVELVLFIQWRRSGKISEAMFPLFAAATVATPVLAFVVVCVIWPDLGAIRVL